MGFTEAKMTFIILDNFNSWELFEQQKVDCHRQLDTSDGDFTSVKKIFDLRAGPEDFKARKAALEANRWGYHVK